MRALAASSGRSAESEKILPRGVMISLAVTWLSSMARWIISS
jgi:hypothetical protein